MEARTIDFGGIGWAVNHMRHGHRMRRKIWRDPLIWVSYVSANDLAWNDPRQLPDNRLIPLRPMLLMHNADDTIGPYVAGQADLLAGDWELFDPPQPGHTSHQPVTENVA